MKYLKQANGNMPISKEQKEKRIENAAIRYGEFLTELGFDWKADENSANTPMRVAKAWMNDLAVGCFTDEPRITTFPTDYKGIVFEGDVDVVSMCSHHNLAFTGVAYIGYIPGSRVVGLSKLNRVVDWLSRRPQIQEGLTQQIHDKLSDILEGNRGVCVVVKAMHTCCSNRGVRQASSMITSSVSGLFETNNNGCKDEFYKLIDQLKK